MLLLIKHVIAAFYFLAGSISDLKTREVADWSNYSLIVLAIAANLLFSINTGDYSYIIHSIIGFAVFFILAWVLYLTGQWGGGDSKMLIGIGALYGMGWTWEHNNFLVGFIINTLIAGAIYGIIWSAALAIKHRKKFMKEYKKMLRTKEVKYSRIAMFIIVAAMLITLFFIQIPSMRFMALTLAILVYATFYLWVMVKAVENSCMYKLVKPVELTEGDWIAKEVNVDGKLITGPKDLGIEKKKIAKLIRLYKQKKVRKILIKEGIPFVPSFLFGWILTLVWGNLLQVFV